MIQKLDMKDPKIAEDVLSVQIPAYKMEANIIEYDDLPPLKDTIITLQQCGETFFGYYDGEKLCGVISIVKDKHVLDIHRLIVHPQFFQKGIAQQLLNFIESHIDGIETIVVSTGSKNGPAVNFYAKNGFSKVEDIRINELLVLTSFKKLLGQSEKREILVDIRKPNELELEQIFTLSPTALLEGTLGAVHPTIEKSKNLIESLLEKGCYYLIATESETLMGWILIGESKDQFTDEKNGFIYELFVIEEYRGRGLSKQLMGTAIDHLKQDGYANVRLSAYIGNHAIKLYEKLGFQVRTVSMNLPL